LFAPSEELDFLMKVKERGGFKKRIILDEVKEGEN